MDCDETGRVWEGIMGCPAKGAVVQTALGVLVQVSVEDIRVARRRLGREMAVGPMINPTAYLDGRRFKNADDYGRLLEALQKVREALATVDGGQATKQAR